MTNTVAQWKIPYLESPIQDTGIVQPKSFNSLPALALTQSYAAAANQPGFAPLTSNPAGMLMNFGARGDVLLASSAPECGGCIPYTINVNPNGKYVGNDRGLYQSSVFTAGPGQQLPNPYNVTGMY